MAEDEPAPFPPRGFAEDAEVVVHRRLNIGGDEGIIKRDGRQERIGEMKSQKPESGDKKPNATSAAAEPACA